MSCTKIFKISDEVRGYKFKYFCNDTMGNCLFNMDKEWEPHISKFVEYFYEGFNTKNIIDIGANFGYHTLFFSRLCTENVFAFEPQLQNFNLLKDNIQLNKIQNVVLSNYACGDTNCDIKLPLYDDTKFVNMGDITPNILDKSLLYTNTKSIRLDDEVFNCKIDLIKIDVQGWEKKVLEGAKNLLKKHKPALIVEFEEEQLKKTNTTSKELFDFIRELDYHIFFIDYCYPADHLCIHNDNLENFRNKFKNLILPHNEDNELNHNIIHGVTEKIFEFVLVEESQNKDS